MTREEQIEQASAINACYVGGFGIVGRITEDKLRTYQNGFIRGAEWSDENPKNLWISIDDDLPCNHEEMINVFVEDVELRSDRVLAMLDDGIMVIAYMYKFGSWSWYWSETERITHWMPIPKISKEG